VGELALNGGFSLLESFNYHCLRLLHFIVCHPRKVRLPLDFRKRSLVLMYKANEQVKGMSWPI
jgi:hypothetical protein